MLKNCIMWRVLLQNSTGALKHLESLAAILFSSKLVLEYEKLRTLKKYIQNMRIFVFEKWSASSNTLFLLLGGFVWNPPWLSALKISSNCCQCGLCELSSLKPETETGRLRIISWSVPHLGRGECYPPPSCSLSSPGS